jgi:hypothetical protein
LLVFNIPIDTEIAPIFATLVEQRAGAVLMGSSLEVVSRTDEILPHAARFVLPTMGTYSFRHEREGS